MILYDCLYDICIKWFYRYVFGIDEVEVFFEWLKWEFIVLEVVNVYVILESQFFVEEVCLDFVVLLQEVYVILEFFLVWIMWLLIIFGGILYDGYGIIFY